MDEQNNLRSDRSRLVPPERPSVQPVQRVSQPVVARRERVLQPTAPSQEAPTPKPLIIPENPIIPPPSPPLVPPVVPPAGPSPYSTLNISPDEIPEPRGRLPIGVYIIAAVSLLSFISSFFNSSQTNLLIIIGMFINLMLGVGLIFRVEIARKVMVVWSALIVLLALAGVVLLIWVQHQIAVSQKNYDIAVSHINQGTLTDLDRQRLATLQTTVSDQRKQVGKIVAVAYGVQIAYILEGTIIIVYLNRPKVKSAFEN